MRFVIQRVKSASVKVENQIVGQIQEGILVLLGFNPNDSKEHVDFAASKLCSIRLWNDEKDRRWASSVKDKNYGILLVSQFTLYHIFKGNKPDFHYAMEHEKAKELYDYFVETLKKKHSYVSTGIFGVMMEVSLVNDGPVTLNWDYPEEKQQVLTEKIDSNQNTKQLVKEKKNISENKDESLAKNKKQKIKEDKDKEQKDLSVNTESKLETKELDQVLEELCNQKHNH